MALYKKGDRHSTDGRRAPTYATRLCGLCRNERRHRSADALHGQGIGARKISVNVVAPGAIETDFAGGVVCDNQEFNKLIASQAALGRVGLPAEIGGAVASLLADDNHWITGQRIEASGGMLL